MWTERSRLVTKGPVLDVEKTFNLGNHFVPVYLHFWWGKSGDHFGVVLVNLSGKETPPREQGKHNFLHFNRYKPLISASEP